MKTRYCLDCHRFVQVIPHYIGFQREEGRCETCGKVLEVHTDRHPVRRDRHNPRPPKAVAVARAM